MAQHVIAAFPERFTARAAADELQDEGIEAQFRVHPPGAVATGESAEEWTETDVQWLDRAVRGAGIGTVAGAAIGFVLGAAGAGVAAGITVGIFAGVVLGGLIGGFRAIWGQSRRDVAVEGPAVVEVMTRSTDEAERAYHLLATAGASRVEEFTDGERVRSERPAG